MIKVEIRNMPALLDRLGTLKQDLSPVLQKTIYEGSHGIVLAARKRVLMLRDPARPKSSKLANSIHITEIEGDLGVTIKADAPYARYVEFGTRKMAAQPFLLPAVEQARPQWRIKIRQAISQMLRGENS